MKRETMSSLPSELHDIAQRLSEAASRSSEIDTSLQALETAAQDVGKAWSGSSLGYHARVYYKDFQPPPAEAEFSTEWGSMSNRFPVADPNATRGEWREYAHEDVISSINEAAGNPNLDSAFQLRRELHEAIDEAKSELLSVLTVALGSGHDEYLLTVKNRVEEIAPLSESDAQAAQMRTGSYNTRDSLAAGGGFQSAPHQDVLARVISVRSTVDVANELATLAQRAGQHIDRLGHRGRRAENVRAGELIFIGHGRSPLWRELKEFIQERLHLSCDEFNRVPVAGQTNVQRLVQMLDDACFAFLVLTAEEQDAEGEAYARLNVVHEAGLFQGRLGFTKAIVMLEEGCAEFSNIEGLGQIRFPQGNIAAAFEEVRRTLEREGLVGPSSN